MQNKFIYILKFMFSHGSSDASIMDRIVSWHWPPIEKYWPYHQRYRIMHR